jgi:prepilin-type N-terminal cleavage/methylation domain-containing protein/prepilin-type processing-associated H-X9-DG protein
MYGSRGEPRLCRVWSRGFTLLELLVVVAVIAVLAAFLFPMFARARESARRTTCLSHLQQIARAHLLYIQDWDERLPDWFAPRPEAPRPLPFGARVFWTELLHPYARCDDLFQDPTAVWEDQGEVRLADYVLPTAGPGGRGTVAEPYWRWPGPPLSLADVVRPSETIHLADGWTTTGWMMGPIPRHGDGLNAGFLDGQARWLPARELRRVMTDDRGHLWLRYAAADR